MLYRVNFTRSDYITKNKIIYMDNAATTKISENVLSSMLPYLTNNYGNPSSQYSLGLESNKAINNARLKIASIINAKPNEIHFTSCASESNNWVLQRIVSQNKNHIITSKIEHDSILNTCKYLEKLGVNITYVDVDSNGFVNPNDIANAITDKTALVSIMYVNNEIGTIQPIYQIGQICKEKHIPFHTDAVQAIGHIKIDVRKENINLLSMSGHKFHAPKGVGVLYIKDGINLSPLIYGGKQENGLRGGTENLASIVGMSTAIIDAYKNICIKNKYIKELRNRLLYGLDEISDIHINGSMDNRIVNNLNVSFKGTDSEALLSLLNLDGICASSASACTSGNLNPSHVLKAIDTPEEYIYNSIRFSLNEDNTFDEVDYVVNSVIKNVMKIRKLQKG